MCLPSCTASSQTCLWPELCLLLFSDALPLCGRQGSADIGSFHCYVGGRYWKMFFCIEEPCHAHCGEPNASKESTKIWPQVDISSGHVRLGICSPWRTVGDDARCLAKSWSQHRPSQGWDSHGGNAFGWPKNGRDLGPRQIITRSPDLAPKSRTCPT